jgi:hypothetical protein
LFVARGTSFVRLQGVFAIGVAEAVLAPVTARTSLPAAGKHGHGISTSLTRDTVVR